MTDGLSELAKIAKEEEAQKKRLCRILFPSGRFPCPSAEKTIQEQRRFCDGAYGASSR